MEKLNDIERKLQVISEESIIIIDIMYNYKNILENLDNPDRPNRRGRGRPYYQNFVITEAEVKTEILNF